MSWNFLPVIVTVVYGSIWLVFFALDACRKIAAKKRKKQMESEGKSYEEKKSN